MEKELHLLPNAGKGNDMERDAIERLFALLQCENMLKEENVTNKAGYLTAYTQVRDTFALIL